MKKRLVSIILTVFLVLSMMPFAAFADDTIVCPACGGSVTKQERRLLTAHDDFYKCDKCGKWAWVNKLGSLSLFSVGDQQILDAADSSAIINFSFNNGKLIPAEKAPSGVGRKDLPGYIDDNGIPYIGSSGTLYVAMQHDFIGFYGYNGNSYYCNHSKYVTSSSATLSPTYICRDDYMAMSASSSGENIYPDLYAGYKLVAPIDGYYSVASCPQYSTVCNGNNGSEYKFSGKFEIGLNNRLYSKGSVISLSKRYSTHAQGGGSYYSSTLFRATISGAAILQVVPLDTVYKQQTNITINNNTWNGNIYTDNSTNLTYIYPQYTTINEKNETVTNISNNPIIYNNETKQYYTYDSVTNNYYYITYETTPTPTPSPSPAPAPTWKPGGGSTRGGGTGRYPADPFTADWTLNYYILNNRRYDAYYALKRTEVDTKNNIPWIDDKHYISTTQIPIANGEYTISVPDGVYWRVWQWDETSKTLTGVNSSNWHGNNFTFLFNTTDEYIFEFCKSDGSEFSSPKDVVLKLKNEKITEYEPGDTIVEEPSPSPSPSPSESPAPAPTDPPTPTTPPTPITPPTPGGDNPGGSGSGSGSGDNSWNPFKWLTDLLKDIVETILKGLWKLLTSIFGFILWLLSLLFKLFPWMPNSGILALCAGVVVVTVIRIIKFITGR